MWYNRDMYVYQIIKMSTTCYWFNSLKLNHWVIDYSVKIKFTCMVFTHIILFTEFKVVPSAPPCMRPSSGLKNFWWGGKNACFNL